MTRLGLIFSVVLMLGVSPKSIAARLTIDAIAAGDYDSLSESHGVTLKTRTGLYFGSIGPVVHYDFLSSDSAEILTGLGLSFGSKTFLEVSANYAWRNLGGFVETGLAGVFCLGVKVGTSVRISMPVVYKRYSSGPATRTQIEYIPYLGVQWNL